MAWLFSKRCQKALKDKKIKVSIPIPVRIRIWKVLQTYNESLWEPMGDGSNSLYQTTRLDELHERIKAELGCIELLAFPENGEQAKPSDLEGFVLRGNYPPYLLDALELFYETIGENKKDLFQRSFNEIMEESGLPWRMADGKIFPVNSAYIDEAIIRRSYELLHEAKFQGALQEFEKARTNLTNGDSEGAIQNANLAVESVIKEILGIERIKPGKLFRKLIDSGLIPEYYRGFLKAFEENILRCVAIIRNEELGVGHGRGPSMNIVPPDLAELALNLSGVLINFLVKQHLQKIDANAIKEVKLDNEDKKDDEGIPF